MDELKPCERCGTSDWLYSQPQFFRVSEEGSYPIGWAVVCIKCGIKVERFAKEEAETIWNTRPLEDAMRAELAAARAEAERPRGALIELIEDARKLIAARSLTELTQSDLSAIDTALAAGQVAAKDLAAARLREDAMRAELAAKDAEIARLKALLMPTGYHDVEQFYRDDEEASDGQAH